jgi:hypothetical protein
MSTIDHNSNSGATDTDNRTERTRNPALCIRCTSEWRRWVRFRSRELGMNESSLVEMACSWFARKHNYSCKSPSIWFPESSPREIDNNENRYKDEALYLNVTTEWKAWMSRFARSQHRSTSWSIEEALREYSIAQGASMPPSRTMHFTHTLR